MPACLRPRRFCGTAQGRGPRLRRQRVELRSGVEQLIEPTGKSPIGHDRQPGRDGEKAAGRDDGQAHGVRGPVDRLHARDDEAQEQGEENQDAEAESQHQSYQDHERSEVLPVDVKHRGDGVQGKVEVDHGVQVSLRRPHRA